MRNLIGVLLLSLSAYVMAYAMGLITDKEIQKEILAQMKMV